MAVQTKDKAVTEGIESREAAFELLQAVLGKRQQWDAALARSHALPLLADPRDRAFACLLALTTLRRLGQIDALMGRFLKKQLPAKLEPITYLLRLGIAQLCFLDVPPHAAVFPIVELAGRQHAALKGLVNAVLRSVAREGKAIIAGQEAGKLNTPAWLWEAWVKDYGRAQALEIAAAHAQEPPLDISVGGDTPSWAVKLGGEGLLPATVRVRALEEKLENLPGYAEGAWWVQDIAASLPVHLLGDVRGKRVVDLCAAPGGKTAQLALAGAEVVAVDRSPQRLRRLRENMERLRQPVEVVEADALTWKPAALADIVLLDAPCTATGTLRRHPDGLWLKAPKDAAQLMSLQRKLLAAAAEMVKPGGVLLYCVCSLQKDEGERQIAAFLQEGAQLELGIAPAASGASRPSFARLPILPAELAGHGEWITPEGDLRTLPCFLAEKGGMDGFYAARLRRES